MVTFWLSPDGIEKFVESIVNALLSDVMLVTSNTAFPLFFMKKDLDILEFTVISGKIIAEADKVILGAVVSDVPFPLKTTISGFTEALLYIINVSENDAAAFGEKVITTSVLSPAGIFN